MKSLADCRYTAFISYCHADDEGWYGWITQFCAELERGLRARLRGVKLPPLHLSGEDGPVAGRLGESLKERIASSYAMVIVVHDHYAESTWCLRELEYFRTLFGAQGLRDRLYVVAMSRSAIERVVASPAWRELVGDGGGDEQLWLPFFDESRPDVPLDVYLDRGVLAPRFRQPFERLREDFVAKLKRATPLPAAAGMASASAVPAAEADGAAARRIVFGFAPPALQRAVAEVADRLRAPGTEVVVLGADALVAGFGAMAGAEALVLPFDDAPLLMPFVPGGQLALQRDAWRQQGGDPARVHGLDLRPAPSAAPAPGGAAHWAADAGLPALAPDALVAALSPRAAAPVGEQLGACVYIESNQHERTLWEPLGEQIRLEWEALLEEAGAGAAPPLYLRPRGLPVDHIDEIPPLVEADGVVLLWGCKTPASLMSQISKVESKLPGRRVAPGMVAYLMPPQRSGEQVPAWGWKVLRFDAGDAAHIDVVPDERDELRGFLRQVLAHRRQRAAVAGPA